MNTSAASTTSSVISTAQTASLAAEEARKIDWNAPWLAHLAPRLRLLDAQAPQKWAQADDMKAALNHAVAQLQAQGLAMQTGLGKPLHFIAQEDLPHGQAYEVHIAQTGGVPTRLNLHDFFNASIWLTFPRIKAVLNARQNEQISAHGVTHQRGMARDALTLFDENSALLVTSNASIATALRQFDWDNALVAPRNLWENPRVPSADAQTVLYLFGHALMDKLTGPRKPMCAHTWVVMVDPTWFALNPVARMDEVDTRLAEQLRTHAFHTHDFCPLPVLGVPHFYQDNADANFYNDKQVFRAGRLRLCK